MILKSRRKQWIAVRYFENKKTSINLKSKKNSYAIQTTQPPANSTEAKSKAILPNRTQLVFLRAVLCWKCCTKPKSFSVQQFYKNAAEVWASSPHLRSKLYLQQVFPAAIAFFGACSFAAGCFFWNKLQIQIRQRGDCSMLAGKSRGGTPFCRTLKNRFL